MNKAFTPRFWAAVAALALAAASHASIGYLKEPIPAPNVSVKDLDGNAFDMKQHRKKVVMVVFWATWCGPCRQEIPHFVDLQKRYAKDLTIVGLSLDTVPPARVAEFAKKYGINYTIAMASTDLVNQYGGVPSIPTMFLVDRKGNLRTRIQGAHSKADIEREVKALLDEKVSPAPAPKAAGF